MLALPSRAVRGAGALLDVAMEAVSRNEPLPLSYAQQRLWFLDQLEPGGVAYNLPMALRMRGALDTGALEASLSELVRRHEILRTTFDLVDGAPVQVIAAPTPLRLEVVDLSELEAEARASEAQRV